MPYFSIIIPVYNKARFISTTLKSVLNQSFPDFELIIINDGSTDNSEDEILKLKDNRIVYFSKKNEGVSKARNFGLEKATSDFICFLDADDFWYPNFLETFHHYINKSPNKKVFTSLKEIETPGKIFVPEYSFIISTDFEVVDFFEASQKECVLWTSNTVIHKSVLDNVGNFDSKIKHGEDTELWIRIGLKYKIAVIATVLARYTYDKESISRASHYFFESYTFQKYQDLENKNKDLKKFMDLNRFSAVIKCKLNGDRNTAKKLREEINVNNLDWKKRILLQLPAAVLSFLIQLKLLLTKIGLSHSVFR
jgi:glycosyltransferase involved in cell wall biosynthesis